MADAFNAKEIILTREKKGVLYNVAPMTNSNMVYTDSETTLTETLNDINKGIDNAVVKEEGKGLSTNDFDNELKDKLETDYTKSEIDDTVSLLNSLLPRVREV